MILTLYRRIRSSSFIKNTSILIGGVSLAHFVPLIAYPILSRLYGPDEFGLLTTLTSITALLGITMSLKYENSILITINSKYAAELIKAILIISLLLLGISELLILFFSTDISLLLKAPAIKTWLWICPLCAFLGVIISCYNEWCIKHAHFKSLSINKIVGGGASPIGKIIFAFSKSSGLFLGELFGQVVTGGFCIFNFFKTGKEYFKKTLSRNLLYLLKRYSDCPKYVLPATLLNKFGQEIPVFLIMAYFSSAELGYYSMASMFLVIPTRVIGKAINDVFRQKANELVEKGGNCNRLYIKIILSLLSFSLICFTFLFVISPFLFKLILGEEWITSGYYCRIICFGSALNFITDFGSALYFIREKMNLFFIWQILYFLLTSLSMIIGLYLFETMSLTLCCLVLGRSIAYILNGVITYSLSKAPKKDFC